MKKLLGSFALALIVAGSALGAVGSRMTCEKTGVVVDSCCCVEKNGSLVCSLTGEEISACCCSPAK